MIVPINWFAYLKALLKSRSEDGEINNQRKNVLEMLAWSEELITDVENQKSWL